MEGAPATPHQLNFPTQRCGDPAVLALSGVFCQVITELKAIEMNGLRQNPWGFAICGLVLALSGFSSVAMVALEGVPPPRPKAGDTRFDAVGAFGVARRMTAGHSEEVGWTDTWYGNATLIAPQLVAVARHVVHDGGTHFEPGRWKLDVPGNYAVRFRRLPDGSLREMSIPNPDYDPDTPGATRYLYPYTVRITAWVLPSPGNPDNITTMPDMLVGILEHAVPHITPIPAAFPAGYQSAFPFTLAGWGSQSADYFSGSPRDGLRLARLTGQRSPFDHSWPSPWQDNGTSRPATRPGPNVHDSGGAILDEPDGTALHYLGCISMVWNGCATTRFQGTKLGDALKGIVPEYSLTYTSSPGGTIIGPASQRVVHGEQGQPVTAVPAPGHHFLRWSDHLDAAVRREEHTIITTGADSHHPVRNHGVTASIDLEAVFAETKSFYSVTFQTEGMPGGSLSGGGEVVHSVAHGADSPAIQAFPPAGSVFVEWTWPGGNRSDSNPIVITGVREDMKVTAHFRSQPNYLIYFAEPGYLGWIAGPSLQEIAPGDTPRPVTAVARHYARFTGWSDGLTHPSRHDSAPSGNLLFTANFTSGTSPLIMQVMGKGTVAPEVHPDDGKGGHTVPYDTPVTIAAIPAPGWRFVEWATTTAATIDQPMSAQTEVRLSADAVVTAHFAEIPPEPFRLTYRSGPGGTISGPTGQSVAEGQDGAPVEASPDAGAVFDRWSDGVASARRQDTHLDGNIEVEARFRSLNGVPIGWYAQHGITNPDPHGPAGWSALDTAYGPHGPVKRLTLLEEYLADTDPNAADSVLTPLIIGTDPSSPGRLRLSMAWSSPHRWYELDRKGSITAADWSVIAQGPGTGADWSFVLNSEDPSGSAFFRMRVMLPPEP